MTAINHTSHPLYAPFFNLYAQSFPIFEQRTTVQQERAFTHPRYYLTAYQENTQFLGFISYWEFYTYIYIEHFAIHQSLRGQGYGNRILKRFIDQTSKIVLLEIDPLVDEVSKARLRFYQQCSFHANPYPHVHAPYREGYKGHPLIILSSQRLISNEEYIQFTKDLDTTVMKED